MWDIGQVDHRIWFLSDSNSCDSLILNDLQILWAFIALHTGFSSPLVVMLALDYMLLLVTSLALSFMLHIR